jgi:hypothetical protein
VGVSSAVSVLAVFTSGRRRVNSLPLPSPSLCASSVPLVHLGQAARQGQAYAQAALVAGAVAVAAAEHFKHVRDGGGLHAYAGVFDADARLRAFAAHRHSDGPPASV